MRLKRNFYVNLSEEKKFYLLRYQGSHLLPDYGARTNAGRFYRYVATAARNVGGYTE
jgi:hypothetical protein